MKQADHYSEARAQEKLTRTPEAQRALQKRAIWRAGNALALMAALALFLFWLPATSRAMLLISLSGNRLMVGLLSLFGLMSISLLWSKGQALDLWLFKTLRLNGYSPPWIDRLMWVTTQLGEFGFAAMVALAAYVLGSRGFAIDFALGSLSLLLLVTILKAMTDRSRPFNLLLDTRVVGRREPGLSFPSGHTAQTFFLMALVIHSFDLPALAAVPMYGLALFVGVTRVYLGVHYPRDVIAGAVLGLIWGNIGALVAPYL